MIENMFDGGAHPVLQRVVQFTQQRQRVLAHNIANLSTPYFKPVDLDPDGFRQALADAVDGRRQSAAPATGPLEVRDTDELSFRPNEIHARPRPTHEGILFHDQNNRDLERTMQHLAENTLIHNAAIEMLRSEFTMLSFAIRERV